MKNEEKFKTPEERNDEYAKYCGSRSCRECALHDKRAKELTCAFRWLALPYEEEKPMPCPFCGGECVVESAWTNEHPHGDYFYAACGNADCLYSSGMALGERAAVARHNKMCKAVKAAREGEAREGE